MGQAPGDFAPGGIALSPQQRRDVIENDHEAAGISTLGGQRGTGANQHAPTVLPEKFDLLPPVGVAAVKVALQHRQERLQSRPFRRDIHELFALALLQVDTENGARGPVGRADAQIRFQRDNAGRQATEYGFQFSTLALQLLLTLPGPGIGPRKAPGHVVESIDQESDLVTRTGRQLGIELASRHVPCRSHELLDRAHEPPGRKEGAVQRHQQSGQQDDAQRQREARLQRRPQERQFRVLLVTGLGALHQFAQLGLHCKPGKQDVAFASRVAGDNVHGGQNLYTAVCTRFQVHVGTALAKLEDQFRSGKSGNGRRCIPRTGGQYAVVGRAENRQFHRGAAAPQIAEFADQIGAVAARQFQRDPPRLDQVFPHLHVQCAAAQLKRSLKSLLQLQAEPAVNPPVDELQREGIDDQQRDDCQDDQQGHHAHRQTRAGHFGAIIARESQDIADDYQRQHADRGDTDQQNAILQAGQRRGVLSDLSEPDEARQPDEGAGCESHDDGYRSQSCMRHLYHSLLSDQSRRQKATKPHGSGTASTRSSVRIRMS